MSAALSDDDATRAETMAHQLYDHLPDAEMSWNDCFEIAKDLISKGWRVAAWRDMESAPWKGPPVLLWKASTREHYVAARVRGAHGPGWCTPDGHEIFRATHWQPLPEPPETP